MSAWWERLRIHSAGDAATWLTARVHALASERRLASVPDIQPYAYLPAFLQEDVLEAAGASWVLQYDFVQPEVATALVPGSDADSEGEVDPADCSEGSWRDDGSVDLAQACCLLDAPRTACTGGAGSACPDGALGAPPGWRFLATLAPCCWFRRYNFGCALPPCDGLQGGWRRRVWTLRPDYADV